MNRAENSGVNSERESGCVNDSDMLLLGREPKHCSFIFTVGSSCTSVVALYSVLLAYLLLSTLSTLNACSINMNAKSIIIQVPPLIRNIQSIFSICKHI